jgi:hypothetical protein
MPAATLILHAALGDALVSIPTRSLPVRSVLLGLEDLLSQVPFPALNVVDATQGEHACSSHHL